MKDKSIGNQEEMTYNKIKSKGVFIYGKSFRSKKH